MCQRRLVAHTSPGSPAGTEEEDQAPAAAGLSARLFCSPAAPPWAKQPLIKGKEENGESRTAAGRLLLQKGDQSFS